jgi:hypothetical protein
VILCKTLPDLVVNVIQIYGDLNTYIFYLLGVTLNLNQYHGLNMIEPKDDLVSKSQSLAKTLDGL